MDLHLSGGQNYDSKLMLSFSMAAWCVNIFTPTTLEGNKSQCFSACSTALK